ncbi:MAG: AI-2E family transporter [Treponema sp.]|nr:AI-2E family transporter [Treponema sp.]
MEETNKTGDKKIFYILLFFAVILTGFLLKSLSSVVLPVIFAVMLSFVLFPIIKKINNKTKIPWIISTLIVFFIFFVIFFGISSLILNSLSTIFNQYPKYEKKFMSIYTIIAENFHLEIDSSQSFIDNVWKNLKVREYIQKAAVSISSGAVAFGRNLLTVVLLAIFLVLEMRITKDKMQVAFKNDKEKFNKISHQIAGDTVHFLSIKFFISLATGILVYIATKILRMDFPLVWAFISFLMNFIPIFGSIIAVIITTLFAILQFYPDSIVQPIFIFIFMIGANFVLGNILEPRIEGKNLGLSPFVILVCLPLWSYIWGFVGMLLAVPMTVIIKIICENIDDLRGIGVILGNKPSE